MTPDAAIALAYMLILAEAGDGVEFVDDEGHVGHQKKSTRAMPSQPSALKAWRAVRRGCPRSLR